MAGYQVQQPLQLRVYSSWISGSTATAAQGLTLAGDEVLLPLQLRVYSSWILGSTATAAQGLQWLEMRFYCRCSSGSTVAGYQVLQPLQPRVYSSWISASTATAAQGQQQLEIKFPIRFSSRSTEAGDQVLKPLQLRVYSSWRSGSTVTASQNLQQLEIRFYSNCNLGSTVVGDQVQQPMQLRSTIAGDQVHSHCSQSFNSAVPEGFQQLEIKFHTHHGAYSGWSTAGDQYLQWLQIRISSCWGQGPPAAVREHVWSSSTWGCGTAVGLAVFNRCNSLCCRMTKYIINDQIDTQGISATGAE